MSDDEVQALYAEKVRYLVALRDLLNASTAMLAKIEAGQVKLGRQLPPEVIKLRRRSIAAAQALGGYCVDLG